MEEDVLYADLSSVWVNDSLTYGSVRPRSHGNQYLLYITSQIHK